MFELKDEEFADLRSQIVTSRLSQWGGRCYKPMAFTQEGVAMLSGMLHTGRGDKGDKSTFFYVTLWRVSSSCSYI
jgi:hypothetical protein